jgi:diguanylate cyclase (GGDEF)-like protein/PAS domain S-box-containing protein
VCEFFTRSVRRPDANLLQMFGGIGAVIGQFLTRKGVEQDIRDSEAQKAGLLEAALDCVITIDHQGRIVEFNPAAERTFGYRREDVVGREMAGLVLPKSLRSEHREGLTRYLETGTSGVIGRRLEITAMRADGTEFPAELSIAEVPSVGRPMFTGFLRDITTQKRMVKQLAFRASHDPLTKSLNRSAFMERFRDAARRSAGRPRGVVAVLFVDIDRFKAINDSLGHFVGDRLLVATARRLRASVRPGDAVARLGGDEFAVLLENVADQTEAAVVADRVRESLREPFTVHGHEVKATASIGVALGLPGVEALSELLRAADGAMYRAKVAGQGLVAGL